MSTERLSTELFGRNTTVSYSGTWAGYALVTLRVVMGWVFFYAGITKVADPSWSAEGYLTHAVPEANPFVGVWTLMANDYLWLVDPLNAWGLTLIGLALLAGAFVRLAAFWGSVVMGLYWASSLPLDHAIVIDSHIVYALLLFGLGAFGAGRLLGVDRVLEATDIVSRCPSLRYLLG